MTAEGRCADVSLRHRTDVARSMAWIPTTTSKEAQVEEILHQFKSASSQGEGNG